MTLSVNDQLKLLHDLLDEHMSNYSGSISEYQQIKRLVKSLTANNKITDSQLLTILPEIYNYGLQGETVQNLPEHITSNVNNLEYWKSAIQDISFE